MLRMTKYGLFFNFIIFYFDLSIKIAYKYTAVDEPVLVRMPQFEKP
jgi:hypothetical protein